MRKSQAFSGKSTLSVMGLLAVSLLLTFAVHRAEAQKKHGGAMEWDPEGAAKYLDDRMQLWFTKAKKLRTGEAKTSCVSCHMTIPYMLARPALWREMGVHDAAPEELRVIKEAQLRVETWGANQPLYDHDERKKVESKGTEAVLNAFILASADSTLHQRELAGATKQAFQHLWEAQKSDGAWDWLDFGLEPYETTDSGYFGAALAAFAVGLAPGSSEGAEAKQGIERLQAYLQKNYSSQSLLNKTWVLLASSRQKSLLSKAEREILVRELMSRQGEDGGWSLASLGQWKWSKTSEPFRAPGVTDPSLLAQADAYATGLILFALRQTGASIQDPSIRKSLQWLRSNQREIQIDQQSWPAWRAHSLNFDREHGGEKGEPWRRMFMSDSATAFAVLAIASR